MARIDLTEWELTPDSTRYLTFLCGRVRRKVADFFMDFLGASVGLDAKVQNRGLLHAVYDYCAESELYKNKSERQNYRQQVYSYCNEQLQAGEEIALEDLSKELPALGANPSRPLPKSRATSWKSIFRRIAARCDS